MPNFAKSVTGKPAGPSVPVPQGHIFQLPIPTSVFIAVSDADKLKVEPNDLNTRIVAWEELAPEPSRNQRWFRATGVEPGNIIVEVKDGPTEKPHIQIAVPVPAARLAWVEKFLAKTKEKAFHLCCETDISMPALLGQAAWESTWGTSNLCVRHNVWFGETAKAGSPGTVSAGGRTFKVYSSFNQAADGYIELVKSVWPGAWAVRADTERYIDTLGLVYDPATRDAYPGAWRTMLREGRLGDFEVMRKLCKKTAP
jgi:Mannosyl-glycoprotein endo-beta-N-acetylglucosaminidase